MKNDLNADQLKQPVTVTIPLSAVLRLAETEPRVAAGAAIPSLPAIGEAWMGGLYAGITVHDNRPMVLVLLPGDEEKKWKSAGEWAAAQSSMLPSRVDALVLWQNLPKEFQQTYYWTSEEYTGSADSAWVAGFSDGDQYGSHKTDGCRCRAVRRVAI